MTSNSPTAEPPKNRPSSDRRRLLGLRHLVSLMLGSDTNTLKQQQLMWIIAGFCFLLVSAIFNWVVGATPMLVVFIYFALLPVLAGLWWMGRWRDRIQLATTILLLLMVVVVGPLGWFYNAGSEGPTLIMYLVLVSYAVGLRSLGSRFRDGLLALLLASPIAWMAIEFWFPHWVVPYPDAETRLIDLMFSFTVSAILVGIIILGHVRRFRQELHKANVLSTRLSNVARKDSLTGLLNHKVIHESVMDTLALEQPFSLIMLDLDHFKRVNDQHGHLYGDTVLVQFALVIRACCEPHKGLVGRAGGEEFMAVVPGSEQAAEDFLSRLRAEWAVCSLEHGTVTFSAGVAGWKSGDTLNSLIQRADDALYRAKHSGRDRWVVAMDSPNTTD